MKATANSANSEFVLLGLGPYTRSFIESWNFSYLAGFGSFLIPEPRGQPRGFSHQN